MPVYHIRIVYVFLNVDFLRIVYHICDKRELFRFQHSPCRLEQNERIIVQQFRLFLFEELWKQIKRYNLFNSVYKALVFHKTWRYKEMGLKKIILQHIACVRKGVFTLH